MINHELGGELLCQLINHSLSNRGVEMCGVIARSGDLLKFVASRNLSSSPRHFFELDPRLIIEHEVRYIFHSHPFGSSRPSSFDKINCKRINIPYLIYSIRDEDFYVYNGV
jgi:proteasome lid subunit RPN8/RPN11